MVLDSGVYILLGGHTHAACAGATIYLDLVRTPMTRLYSPQPLTERWFFVVMDEDNILSYDDVGLQSETLRIDNS